MRTLLAIGLLGVFLSTSRADDDASKIVQKALAAHGGKPLTAAKGLRYKWTASSGNGDEKITTTSERWVEFPDKVLGVSETAIGKTARNASSGFDGKVAWLKAGGAVKELDADAAKSLRETVFPDRVMSLIVTQEKDLKVSIVGEAKVGERATVGVRLERKNATDVNLYFDKETHLLAKAEWRGKNLDGTEVREEQFFSDYKQADGIKYPTRITIHQDGKETQVKELTEYELLKEGLGAGHFAKPKE